MSKQVQTIEKTGKRWKGLMVLSAVSMIVGGVMWAAAESSAVILVGQLCVLGGGLGVILAKVGAWWHHG